MHGQQHSRYAVIIHRNKKISNGNAVTDFFVAVYAAVTQAYNVFQWAGQLSKTIPLHVGDLNLHLIHSSLGQPESRPNDISRLDQFIGFARLTSVTNRHTQEQNHVSDCLLFASNVFVANHKNRAQGPKNGLHALGCNSAEREPRNRFG